jgi:hypothetical protein
MSSIITHFFPSHYCHISFTSARNPEQYGGALHHVHSIQRNGLFTTGADSGRNGAKVEVLLKKKQKDKVWSRGDVCVVHGRWRWDDEEIAAESSQLSFAQGVEHFNAGEYYECHDVMEGLWNNAPEPQRSILHGILQCSVGLHHLLHQNHRGAMVELGEGLTKLRRVGLEKGPLHAFEREASAVLEFVYNTQLEHAACAEDMCITMDGSEQSYQLLGNFGAGEMLYRLNSDGSGDTEAHIVFFPQYFEASSLDISLLTTAPIKVKVPTLQASEEDLYQLS